MFFFVCQFWLNFSFSKIFDIIWLALSLVFKRYQYLQPITNIVILEAKGRIMIYRTILKQTSIYKKKKMILRLVASLREGSCEFWPVRLWLDYLTIISIGLIWRLQVLNRARFRHSFLCHLKVHNKPEKY